MTVDEEQNNSLHSRSIRVYLQCRTRFLRPFLLSLSLSLSLSIYLSICFNPSNTRYSLSLHSFSPSLALSVHLARVFCAALSRTLGNVGTAIRVGGEWVRVGAREKIQRTAWGERCSVFGWGTGRDSGNRDEVERLEGGEKASCRSV